MLPADPKRNGLELSSGPSDRHLLLNLFNSGSKKRSFGKPCLCMRDTRHFRRFTGFEQQRLCFISQNANSSFFAVFWSKKKPLFGGQKHGLPKAPFLGPRSIALGGRRINAIFYCAKFCDNPSGHGHPRRIVTSVPKSAFSLCPSDGEKLFDP